MTSSTLGLARPELLAFLLLAPLLAALVVIAGVARTRALRMFSGASGLAARSGARMWLKGALLLVAFVSVVIALAGPFVDLRVRGARRLGVDIVLAIDVSQSMATRDVEPDRLRAARHLAEELGNRVVGSRVSLVLFAGQGTLRYPATTDPKILGEVLDNSGKGVRLQQGSSLAAGLQSALAAFPSDSEAERGRAIVIVSDGEITLGAAPDAAALDALKIKLYTIGIGTPTGGQIPLYDPNNGNFTGYLRGADGVAIVSKLDETGLRQLAADGGGAYWRYAGDDTVIGDLASSLRTLEAVEPVENAGSVPDERSRLFVAIAVAAILAERLLSDRRRMPAPRDAERAQRAQRTRRGRRPLGAIVGSALLWAMACGGNATSIDAANAKFAAGDYRAALAAYRDLQAATPDAPELAIDAGNSLYMLGDFGRALPDYAHAIDIAGVELRAIAQYDRGDALFRLGRLEDARDAFREALRLDPNDRDAKFNLEVVNRLIDAKAAAQQQPQPGPSAPPGQSNAPAGGSGGSGSTGPTSSLKPGENADRPSGQVDPKNDRAPDTQAPGDLRTALNDFRKGLTVDDVLRVLDALEGQQRGIEQLIEGPRRAADREY